MSEIAQRPCVQTGCAGLLDPADQFCKACGTDQTVKQWARKGLASPRRKVKTGGVLLATGLVLCWVVTLLMPHESVVETITSGGPDWALMLFYALVFLVGAITAALGFVVLLWGALHGGFRVASGERVGSAVSSAADAARPLGNQAKERAQKLRADAAPLGNQAKERAQKLRADAAPRVDQAKDQAAQGVRQLRDRVQAKRDQRSG